jgi:Lsr2
MVKALEDVEEVEELEEPDLEDLDDEEPDERQVARLPKAAATTTEASSADIRAWARGNDLDVPQRGRLNPSLVEAFEADDPSLYQPGAKAAPTKVTSIKAGAKKAAAAVQTVKPSKTAAAPVAAMKPAPGTNGRLPHYKLVDVGTQVLILEADTNVLLGTADAPE